MKIVTWNVNGIRSLKVPLKSVLDKLAADIICFQETKVIRSQVDHQLAFVEGYTSYFSFPRYQSGYSGVVTYVADRASPIKAEEGLSEVLTTHNKLQDAVGYYGSFESFAPSEVQLLDSEGRAVITKHMVKCAEGIKPLAVINVYCPRADPEKPERGQFKLQFYKLLQERAEALVQSGSYVLIVGDINTSHKTIDHCDPGEEEEFYSRPSRKWMDNLLRSPTEDSSDSGPFFVDSFRYFYPDKASAFTCWCNVTGARKTNYGTRIDYIICDSDLISHFSDTVILPEIEGSDHCPVAAYLKLEPIASAKYPSLCTCNWPEFSGKQVKISNFLIKNAKDHATTNNEEPKASDTKVSQAVLGVVPSAKKSGKVAVNKQKTIASFFQKMPTNKNNTCDTTSNCVFPNIITQTALEVALQDASSSKQTLSKTNEDIDLTAVQSCNLVKLDSLATENDCARVEGSTSELSTEGKCSQAELWKNLLSGPQSAPLCNGHQEPCVLRTVKKAGPNCGRQFYVCARPDGHASNPEARCDYFQWLSAKKKKLS